MYAQLRSASNPPLLQLLLEDILHAPLHSSKVLRGGNIVLARVLATGNSQVLGHDAINVDSVNARLFKALGKGDDFGRLVELAALHQAAGPGKDGGDGVGARLVAFLVLAVVARDGAVGGFRLKGFAVGGDED